MIKVTTSDECKIPLPNARTKVTTMGNVIELTWADKPFGCSPCVKIDKEHFMDKRTGEVFEIRHWENRADGKDSVRKTMENIRALINTNVTVPENCLWCTFTYAENMTDPERLYNDYKAFWKRFQRFCKKKDYEVPQYILVVEPQGRGAWHIHSFLIWNKKAPFIANEAEMEPLWRQGFTKVKAVKDTDNAGAYFTAYLGDIPLDEAEKLSGSEKEEILAIARTQTVQKEFEDEEGLIKKKKFIKGGRLPLYPAGMNIVRASRKIKRPIVELMAYEKAEKKATAATVTFERSYSVADEQGEINTISKAYYNTKRRPIQDK